MKLLLISNIAIKLEKSADTFSKSDPYVCVIYGTSRQRTHAKMNVNSASWDKEIIFPLESVIDTFTVQVFDKDKHTRDDMILSETFKITDSAEKGAYVEQNGIKLFYGIGSFYLLENMKKILFNVDKVQEYVNKVYSSFNYL